MSEGNKLPALSVEVKNFNRCESLADEWIQNENGLIDILENETNNEKHRVCLNTFEVKS